jgi:nucleoside-diphosphate-sugar epimerase
MVLAAAQEANVSRVVVTSSVAAMFQFGLKDKTVTETDWCPPEKAFSAYQKSKILAEKSENKYQVENILLFFLKQFKFNNRRMGFC